MFLAQKGTGTNKKISTQEVLYVSSCHDLDENPDLECVLFAILGRAVCGFKF